MGRKSAIKMLDPELRKEVDRLLLDGRFTIRDVVAHLEKLGAEVSKSAVHRYSQDFERVAQKIRTAREMAQAIGREVELMPDSDMGRLAIESLQATLLNVQMRIDDDDVDSKTMSELARSAKDLASAMKSNVEMEFKIRDRALKEAAEAAEDVGRSEGLSVETIDAIKSKILGIARERR